MIPQAKITALREALERDGSVTFKNGSVVERQVNLVTEIGEDGKVHPVDRVIYIVARGYGGSTRFTEGEIRRAYEMALYGPRPKQQPPERDYGEAPF